jgi:hypothetical protein
MIYQITFFQILGIILFSIYFTGVVVSLIYITFWNADLYTDSRMKEINPDQMYKSWWFFVIKNKLQV